MFTSAAPQYINFISSPEVRRSLCSSAASGGGSSTAKSLSQAFKFRNTATALIMSSHPDLLCMNMMCEKVGGPCACRLALALSRMPLLRRVDISRNSFNVLPDSLTELSDLQHLDLSCKLIANELYYVFEADCLRADNGLKDFPTTLASCPKLSHLDLSYNSITEMGAESLRAFPALSHLDLRGNPLSSSSRTALAAASLPQHLAVLL